MEKNETKSSWNFDLTKPSEIGQELERTRRISERSSNKEKNKPKFKGWSIGKMSEDEKFLMMNTVLFGTRQRRKSK